MSRKPADRKDKTIPCKFCGADIPVNAKACPACGSDEQTGWSEETYLDGIDLPDDDSYEEISEREFGTPPLPKRRVSSLPLAGIAVVLLILAVGGLVAGMVRC